MYKAGDLLVVGGPECQTRPYDSREDHAPMVPAGHVILPHSCDDWVIGGEPEARALIADLWAAFPHLDVPALRPDNAERVVIPMEEVR